MITKTIALSGYDLSSYFYNSFTHNIIEDLVEGTRIVGNSSGVSYFENGVRTTIQPIEHKHVLDLPIDLRENTLSNAILSLEIWPTLPPIDFDDQDFAFIYDWRYPYLQNIVTTGILLGFATNTVGSYDVINSYYEYSNTSLTSSIIDSFNAVSGTIYNISIFDILAPHINNSNWQRNNSVNLFFSGIPSGSGANGVLNLANFKLHLYYEATTPSKPLFVSASETEYRQITVNWTPPLDNGDASIINYDVQYGIQTGISNNYISTWQYAGTSSSTSLQIDSLDFDNNYVFRVAARNASGLGAYSTQTQPITVSRALAPLTSLAFNEANNVRIRLRRDTYAAWTGINPTLALGEAAYETDTYKLKVGDGINNWTGLPYIRVDNDSIDFPDPPDVYLTISSSITNSNVEDRIIINLSDGERLSIIGSEGVNVDYSDSYNRIIISADKLYDPVAYGTIYNPTSSGTPGSLMYDQDWFYFCTDTNYWQRTPLDKRWLDLAKLTVSNTSGSYPSTTNMIFDNRLIRFTTDGDPFPAMAGRPLTNTGIRTGFRDSFLISEHDYAFLFTSRAGTNTTNPMLIDSYSVHGLTNNGVIILSCDAGSGAPPGFVSAPSGFTYNAIAVSNFVVVDDCGGSVDSYGVYKYRDGRFLSACWNTPAFYNANAYYSGSHYNNDYFRHTDGHSKIIGFCLDGYPIYGPYGYADSIGPDSGIQQMVSSYSGLENDLHRPTDWKFWNTMVIGDAEYSLSPGLFNEDFVYVSGYGSLDEFNGRFGITPDFPSGTYAYFLTFSDSGLQNPQYPYIFGTGTKEQRPPPP